MTRIETCHQGHDDYEHLGAGKHMVYGTVQIGDIRKSPPTMVSESFVSAAITIPVSATTYPEKAAIEVMVPAMPITAVKITKRIIAADSSIPFSFSAFQKSLKM